MRIARIIAPLLLIAAIHGTALAQSAAPSDPLVAARDLYASARYDEALAMLNEMHPNDGPNANAERRSIEQYRSLCLLALGRASEAETAIAAVVTSDPWYQPSESDASPRVRAAFSDVRQRLLPDISSQRYAVAKAAYDRKDYVAATQQFRQVMALLDDPDMHGRLGDLKLLAKGFLDLSVVASAPPQEPPKREAFVPPPAPQPQVDPNRIYTADDANVVPPIPIRQAVPRLSGTMTAQARDHGVLEILIDESGRVIAVTIRESLQIRYDAVLMNAARDWRYQPATVNGRPVKYRKLIQVNLSKQEQQQ
jgi:tetratricopeptide (TPR) repeat protein